MKILNKCGLRNPSKDINEREYGKTGHKGKLV
jgi:hypothetical protein